MSLFSSQLAGKTTPPAPESSAKDPSQETAMVIAPADARNPTGNPLPPGAFIDGIGAGGKPIIRDKDTKRIVKGSAPLPNAGKPQHLSKIVRDIVHFPGIVSFLQDLAIGKLAAGARMADRVKAAEILLDRGFGKPQVHVEVKDETAASAREKVAHLATADLANTVDGLRRLLALQKPEPEPIDAEIIEAGEALGTSPEVLAPALRTHAFTNSSNIESATLDNKGLLRVTFTSGASYAYLDVTDAEWDAWLAAPSAGKYFATIIKRHALVQ